MNKTLFLTLLNFLMVWTFIELNYWFNTNCASTGMNGSVYCSISRFVGHDKQSVQKISYFSIPNNGELHSSRIFLCSFVSPAYLRRPSMRYALLPFMIQNAIWWRYIELQTIKTLCTIFCELRAIQRERTKRLNAIGGPRMMELNWLLQ